MDFQKLMQQARQMQSDLLKIEDELNETEYIGASGGGAVQITVNGSDEVQHVEINDDLMGADNKEMLQDLILIAMNEAVSKAKKDKEGRLGNVAGGLGIAGL